MRPEPADGDWGIPKVRTYLAEESAEVRLIAHPEGREPLGDWPVFAPGASAALAIGPEGGMDGRGDRDGRNSGLGGGAGWVGRF